MRTIEDVLESAHKAWKMRVLTDSKLHTRKAMQDIGPTMLKDFAAALLAERPELGWECRSEVSRSNGEMRIEYRERHEYSERLDQCFYCRTKREDV